MVLTCCETTQVFDSDEPISKITSSNLNPPFHTKIEQSSDRPINSQFTINTDFFDPVDEQNFTKNLPTNRSKRSSANDDTKSKAIELLNDMKEFRVKIEQTKSSAFIDNDHKKHLVVIDNIIQLLKSSLRDQNESRPITEIGKKFKLQFIKEATRAINNFKIELHLIQYEIHQKYLRIQLLEQCAQDIEAQRFSEAREIFTLLTDSEIKDLIKKLYNHQAGSNFDLLLEFSDHVTEISMKFIIYSELNHQIQNNRHDDPFQLIKLVKKLTNDDQLINSDSEYNTQAQHMTNDLINRIRSSSKKLLKEAASNNLRGSTEDLINEVASFQNKLFKEIITDIVRDSNVFGKPNTKQLIYYVSTFRSLEQSIFGLTSIYDNTLISDSVMFTMAIALQKLMRDSRYSTSSSLVKSECESLKTKIPASVTCMVYSSSLSIKNDHFGEDLFVSNDVGLGHGNTNFVFTYISGDRDRWYPNRFRWIFENVKDQTFYIKNVHLSQYLYPSDIETPPRGRQVFASANLSNMTVAEWNVIRDGEKFYLKNNFYNEFLTTGSQTTENIGSKLRNAFTLMTKKPTRKELWKIENCK